METGRQTPIPRDRRRRCGRLCGTPVYRLPTSITSIPTARTVLGDESEMQAIKTVLDSRVACTWLNSTKSLVGHCLTAAGAIEAIATILQMHGKFLHPNLNLDHPIDAECRFVGAAAEFPVTVKTALSNSFGFGGICSSVAFRSEA
jgi:malonyl-ACP decarboxylase